MIQSIFSQSELVELENIFNSPKKNFQKFISLIDGKFESYNRKLMQNIEKYQYIIENALEGVWIIDSEDITIYVNSSMANILGYSIEDMIGKSVFHFMNEKSEKETRIHIENRKKGISAVRESQMIHKKGYKVYLRMKATPIFNDEGEYEGTFAFISDITEKKESEQKLKENEELYRTLVQTSPDAITVSDLKGNIIELSERALEMNGFTLEEMIGKSAFELIAPEDHKRVIENIQKTLKEGEVRNVEYHLLRKDGSTFIGELNASIIKDIKGRPKAFISSIRDITKRKRAEEALKESEENFRTIAEQAFMGILMIQNEKIEYVNKALLQIFGYSYEEISDWYKEDLLGLIHPDDLQFLREYRQKLRVGDPSVKPYYSYRVFTNSGKLKWIDQFSKPIIYRGKPAELVTIMDITEKKEAEQELMKLNSLKSELLRRTSHELKTPLVSIKGYTDLLLSLHKETLDDYILDTIKQIKMGCNRLENLIGDILRTAELESGKVELKKIRDDLSFLIKLCIRELKGFAQLRNQRIELDIYNNLITNFEYEQIHQVIGNLLSNAIKYTPPYGNIIIHSEIKDDTIIIGIKDNGIGFTEEEKQRLFTQFGKIERYGQGWDLDIEGSGLGLYISKRIIELHDGKIWVESEGRGKGSTFYFSLPLIK